MFFCLDHYYSFTEQGVLATLATVIIDLPVCVALTLYVRLLGFPLSFSVNYTSGCCCKSEQQKQPQICC